MVVGLWIWVFSDMALVVRVWGMCVVGGGALGRKSGLIGFVFVVNTVNGPVDLSMRISIVGES